MTKFFEWIETRLDAGGWIRRTYLVVATVMTWRVMTWSMAYADAAKDKSGADIAAVIGAVSLVVGAVQTMAFKHYLESRKDE